MGEGDEHEEQPDAVDAVCRDPRVGPAAAALAPDELEDLALPVADEPLDPLVDAVGRAGQVGAARAAGPSPPGIRRQARVVVERGGVGVRPQQGGDAGLEGLVEVLAGRRAVALDGGGEPVAPLGRRSTRPGGRTRPSRRTPASGRGPRRGAGSRRSCPRGPRPRRPRTRAAAALMSSALAAACASLAASSRAVRSPERGDGAAQGLADDDRAGPGVARQGVQPAAQPAHRRVGRVPSAVRVVSGIVKIGVVASPWSRSISTQVGTDLVDDLGRDPVEDDGDGGAALGGGAEQLPRDGVGIPGGSRDEEPHVGGGEELGGELAVGVDDGVDVGSVEQRHPRRAGRSRRRAGRCRAAAPRSPAGDPGQPGQDPAVGEPPLVVGTVDEDRARRRRADDPGAAHLGADDRVDEGGLAGAGRAADDGEERGVEGA